MVSPVEASPWRLLVVALAVFVVGFFVYHDKTDFAFYYHTDEPTKVTQLQGNERNYFHPLLLINTAGLLYDLEGRPADKQQAVETGRLASGIFSAAALAIITVVAILHGGWVAGLIACAALLLNHNLYEFAHYFKEDPALNFSLAVLCLAATLYERRSSVATAVLVGLGCGLALSAKYLGVIALPFGLLVLFAGRTAALGRWAAVGWFILGFVGTVLLVNWQAVPEFGKFVAGFQDEMTRAQGRFDEAGTFQTKAWQRIMMAFTPLTLLLLVGYFLSPLFRPRRLTVAEWVFVGIPATFALFLFFASRSGGRYNSPIILLSVLAAAIAAGWIVQALLARAGRHARWVRIVAPLVLLGAVFAVELPDFSNSWKNLRTDTRLQLKQFIGRNLPLDAWIAEESDADLSDPAERTKFTSGMEVPRRRWLVKYGNVFADEGTIEEWRAKGVTHIVLVWNNDKKRLSRQGPDTWDQVPQKRRAETEFIYRLTTEGNLLWECRGGSPDHIRPALRLYELPPS